MEVLFEVKSIVADWNPPFQKKITSEEIKVPVNKSFERIKQNSEFIFKVVKATPSQVLIEYNRYFTLKGNENPGNRQVWIQKGQEQSFTYLWGEKGITKKLKVKDIVEIPGESVAQKPQPAEVEEIVSREISDPESVEELKEETNEELETQENEDFEEEKEFEDQEENKQFQEFGNEESENQDNDYQTQESESFDSEEPKESGLEPEQPNTTFM